MASPMLTCLRDTKVSLVLTEFYREVYGNHISGQDLTYKLVREGHYWQIMIKDYAYFI